MAETERESRKAWGDLPENHRALMRASIGAALSEVLDENARLRDELREIADCPKRGVKAESTDGQAWNDRAWVIERARAALSPGGGADPTRVGVSGGVPSEAAPELERGGGAERPEEET
jgi:hypothetical protein